jgi:hypothetical protein
MPKKVIFLFFGIAALFALTACEHTKKLWEDSYLEKVKNFLISQDGKYVVFLGKNYHYVFSDDSGILKEILELDKDKIIEFDDEKSEIKLDDSNNLEATIFLKTFDLELLPQESVLLKKLGFKTSLDDDFMSLIINLRGKLYKSENDSNFYNSALEETYDLKIIRHASSARDLKKISLTPITLIEDSVLLIGEILLIPFRE